MCFNFPKMIIDLQATYISATTTVLTEFMYIQNIIDSPIRIFASIISNSLKCQMSPLQSTN